MQSADHSSHAQHLCRHSFQHYIAEDAYFLSAFASAYSLAAAQSQGNVAETLQELLAGTHEELKLHSSYAKVMPPPLPGASKGNELRALHAFLNWSGVLLLQDWGVTIDSSRKPAAATEAYCAFLLDVAHNQVMYLCCVRSSGQLCSCTQPAAGCGQHIGCDGSLF